MSPTGTVLLVSLMTGLAIQPLLIPWLRRRGIVDVPNERSSHGTVTPRGGGLGILIAFCLGSLVGAQAGLEPVLVLVLGSLVLGSVGFADDVRGLGAITRLAIQLSVGAVAGLLLPSPVPVMLAVPLLAVWAASYVNAFNFMDGINGISALSGFVAGLSYVLLGFDVDSTSLVAIGAALCGASLSFLPYNFPTARVFPGDVGSYSLGFVIAALAWLAWALGVPPLVALAPTALYLVDTGTTLIRRARAGQALMEAHHSHVYQQLLEQGHSHTSVAILVPAIQASVSALVWWAYSGDRQLVCLGLAAALLTGYAASPRLRRHHGVHDDGIPESD